MRTRWLPVLLLMTLGGCVHLGPPSLEPQAYKAQAVELPAVAERTSQAAWWQQLTDPQLQWLLALADAEGLDAKRAEARLKQVRAQAAGVDAAAGPQVTLQPALDRVRNARRQPGSDMPDEGRLTFNRLGLDATASWDPDPFGRNDVVRASAKAQADAARLDLVGARGAVRAALLLAYLQLAQAEAQATIAAQLLALAEADRRSLVQRQAAGLAQPADVEEAELAVLTQQQAAREALHAGSMAKHQLALLTGQEPAALRLAPVNTNFLRQEILRGAADPLSVLAQRADVQAAWHRWQAAHQDSQLARLERFPKLALSASGGWTADSLKRFLRDDASMWLVGVRLSIPLLDAGRIRASAMQAQAQSELHGLDYRSTVLGALQQVATQLVLHEAAAEQAHLAAQRTQQLRSLVERQQRAQLAGRLAPREVRNTEIRLLQQEAAERGAQSERFKSAVLLQQATGALS
jgi:NodT family efflux transporter outer membrane factor (OMF) lipoprotein